MFLVACLCYWPTEWTGLCQCAAGTSTGLSCPPYSSRGRPLQQPDTLAHFTSFSAFVPSLPFTVSPFPTAAKLFICGCGSPLKKEKDFFLLMLLFLF